MRGGIYVLHLGGTKLWPPTIKEKDMVTWPTTCEPRCLGDIGKLVLPNEDMKVGVTYLWFIMNLT